LKSTQDKLRVLITGAAGFIGFHLSKELIASGHKVLGVDNLNDYYNPKLKADRLTILNGLEQFQFSQTDITSQADLKPLFESFKPHRVVNLAAQAGVRHSITHPQAYIDANLTGFFNILELCRRYETPGLIYASSSSVYGGNKEMPFSVEDRVDSPMSLYAATKKANELMAYSYSHLYGLHTTGLRFFTVYGPFGRPDMALYIFTQKIVNGESIQIFNHGKMKRDFTYVDDIVQGTISAIMNNYVCEVFNIGNHRSEDLMEMVRLIEENLGKKAKIEYLPIQPGDVPESFADIKKSTELLGYIPSVNISEGIKRFVDWYKKYPNHEA
jgi:UDP-glucuronate 4-epimerase